jgi:replicative DNA helicase
MVALSEASAVVDPVTLKDQLLKTSELEAAGGIAYIASLLDGVPRLVNAEHHAKIVKEKSLLRRLIEEAGRISSLARRDEGPAEEVLDEAEKAIFRLAEDRLSEGFLPIQSVAEHAYALVERLTERKETITGVPTGFVDLDELTSGLQPSELVILAARPSMGKTAFALNIAENAALKHNRVVGVFSLEMAREQLFLRMLGSQSRVDLHRIRTGRVSNEDWTRMLMAFQTLGEAKIFIDDARGQGVMEMRAKARRLKAEHGLDLLVIDYLQLMSGHGRYDSRQQEISDISRSLKELAKELRIPVLAPLQLSRAPETRSEDRHRPRLSDLREAEQSSRRGRCSLHLSPEVYFPNDEDKKGGAELIIGKQRNGPIDTVQPRVPQQAHAVRERRVRTGTRLTPSGLSRDPRSQTAPPGYRATWAEVDLDRIASNFAALRALRRTRGGRAFPSSRPTRTDTARRRWRAGSSRGRARTLRGDAREGTRAAPRRDQSFLCSAWARSIRLQIAAAARSQIVLSLYSPHQLKLFDEAGRASGIPVDSTSRSRRA